jgi:hypothetical protein
MIKTSWLSLLKYNKFTFGKQIVSQFVIFECKFFIFINLNINKIDFIPMRLMLFLLNYLDIIPNIYILTENITKKIRKNIIQYFPISKPPFKLNDKLSYNIAYIVLGIVFDK